MGQTVDSGPAGAPAHLVGPYLAGVLGDQAWAQCTVALIPGGRSNLTYVVSSAAGSVILRRPPLGHVLPTAHDMGREYRVMGALAGTSVPVPRMLHRCEDRSVLGASFYVMERVEGHILRSDTPSGPLSSPAVRHELTDALVETLAALHDIDPAAVGLAGFGRPAGYLERQLRRWSSQWDATRVEAGGGVDPLLTRLRERLPTPARETAGGTVVHGDYRLDNLLVAPDPPARVAAVLDWEMATLGDPLADLGLLLVYWQEAGDVGREVLADMAVTRLDGFPTRRYVAARYAALSGRDLGALPWYVAFGFFKLAVVCAGIAARGRAGAMVGVGFVEAEERVAPLAELGHAVLDADALI